MNLDDAVFLRCLGARLRDRRAARGLTQAQLGEQCGLHRNFIGSVERGELNLSILNLRTISRVLRVPLADLLAASRADGPTWRSITALRSEGIRPVCAC
jgi:transcriptional regulator with XRE-family HTH domain